MLVLFLLDDDDDDTCVTGRGRPSKHWHWRRGAAGAAGAACFGVASRRRASRRGTTGHHAPGRALGPLPAAAPFVASSTCRLWAPVQVGAQGALGIPSVQAAPSAVQRDTSWRMLTNTTTRM